MRFNHPLNINGYVYPKRLRGLAILISFLLISTFGFAEVAQNQPLSKEYPSRFISVNGVKLHYVDKGQGETMLFLHGYPFFWYGWKNMLDEFHSTYRVIAPDNRGYNLSDKPAPVEQYHLSILVEDVSKLIETLVPENKVILIGHDWGGTLAWTFAQKYPNQVSKLIVINAPPYNVFLNMLQNNPIQQKSAAYMDILKSGAVEQKFAQEGPDMLWNYGFHRQHAKGVMSNKDKAAYFEAWSQPGALKGALNWYRANVPTLKSIATEHYWPSVNARVKVPSLLVWTDGERVFVPETPKEVAKVTDNLKVVTISDSGHSPFLDQPEQLARHIKAFITP